VIRGKNHETETQDQCDEQHFATAYDNSIVKMESLLVLMLCVSGFGIRPREQ